MSSTGSYDSGGITNRGDVLMADSSSKTVMLASERNDRIQVTEEVQRFNEEITIPEEVSVIRRTDTYFGPKLLVHAEIGGEDYNYLLTAPGPDSHLHLWGADLTDEGMRKGWNVGAEVKAILSTEQPPYEKCAQCSELIRTIHHERKAVLGMCSRGETYD